MIIRDAVYITWMEICYCIPIPEVHCKIKQFSNKTKNQKTTNLDQL